MQATFSTFAFFEAVFFPFCHVFQEMTETVTMRISMVAYVEQAQDDVLPPLVQLANLLVIGFFYGFVEGGSDGFAQHKIVAIAEFDCLPIGIARLTSHKAEVEAAENGDDGTKVLGADGVGATIDVVGMVVLAFGVDDDDAARVAHGSSAGKGEGDDVETGVGLIVGVVDFYDIHVRGVRS